MRRSEKIYKSISNKYLLDYAVECAWREDARAMSVGLSKFWRGYSQGIHRTVEVLVEGLRPAEGRGRHKGWVAAMPR